MRNPLDSEERALADRLVNYADALVAVAVVGASGLGAVLADPDSREYMERAANYIIVVNVISAFVVTGAVVLLRRWEKTLRADLPPAPLPRRYGRYLHVARIAILWLATGQVIALMRAIQS